MTQDEDKNQLFKIAQEYTKPCPLIIWGSGATISYGLPSMDDLKRELGLSSQKGNLEDILSKKGDRKKAEYKQQIFEIINQKDDEFRADLKEDATQPIVDLISHFNPHPCLLNIVTTNYDCVLEYVFGYYGFPFSDGFTGHEFSKFDEKRFNKNLIISQYKNQRFINLYKVHGSLRWCNCRYSYHNKKMDGVLPSTDKYEESHKEPFRTIISKADAAIEDASCFLAVGFGFNDGHLTPKIETAINSGKSILIITKTATDACKEKLSRAKKYMLIEKGEENKTKFTFKKNRDQQNEEILGSYWQLNQFNKIIGAN